MTEIRFKSCVPIYTEVTKRSGVQASNRPLERRTASQGSAGCHGMKRICGGSFVLSPHQQVSVIATEYLKLRF